MFHPFFLHLQVFIIDEFTTEEYYENHKGIKNKNDFKT